MGAVKNTIRCCISCILPCGALDVIRIVHSNGRVEELSKTIRAGEVMKAHPKHVLRKSAPEEGIGMPRIVVLPPDAELQRGKIYFLVPVPAASPPEKPKRRKKRDPNAAAAGMSKLLLSERYLSEILSEKISTQRDRRRGRVGVWRPHLESISEASGDS